MCLGDGEGRNGVWLAEQGHQVTTVDFSEVGVAKAKAWAAERGVSIDAQVADLEQWIFSPAADGPWDGLVMIFCHFPAELRAKIARVLTLKMAPQSWLLME
ncbi:MAG: SAM-dependent methyltransferase, partial [Propionibacterium sp.]